MAPDGPNVPGLSTRTGRRPTAAEIEQAAALCWEDRLRDAEIAAQLGISRRTLARWKHRDDFKAAYAKLQRQCESALRRRMLANLRRRLA